MYNKQRDKQMNALRKVVDIKAGKLVIDIPPDFATSKVEVIILPIEGTTSEITEFQKLLLNAPTLTDDEFGHFTQVKEQLSQWDVK